MGDNEVFVGKDILRLITVAMYDDPLVLYREYIQNAVDSIDSSVCSSFEKNDATISIVVDDVGRSITIRDNGKGIKKNKFVDAMTVIGQSEKVAEGLRGLWGVGRLAGLAYCQRVIFTTKALREKTVSRIEWDGKKFREILVDTTKKWNLQESIQHISEITTTTENADSPAFFQVQLDGVIRHGNDVLFNKKEVAGYISQVAPVPFHFDFPFRRKIENFLSHHMDVSGYRILLDSESVPVCRPFRKEFLQSPSRRDVFSDCELITCKNRKDETVAVGWTLHHSYLGALKASPYIRGIRARIGNMQIGNERVLVDIFPEPRFNSWAVGEVHILDANIRPNGQRTEFEDTRSYRDIKNKLAVSIGKTIPKNCRIKSADRNKVRIAERKLKNFELCLDIIEENILSPQKTAEIMKKIEEEVALDQMNDCRSLHALQKIIINRLQRINTIGRANLFNNISKPQQKIVKDVAGIIYDYAPDSETAKKIICELREHIGNGHN